jgi:hypothetical protein
MTIYGTQAIYQDVNNGQTPFRNGVGESMITADVTGLGFSVPSLVEGKYKISLPSGFNKTMIASTNQPQISLLFNSTIVPNSSVGERDFKVYYSASFGDAEENFSDVTISGNYSYTSSYTNPGYYYIVITNKYLKYKKWIGSSVNTPNEEKSQVYFFQIKDQTPELKIYQLLDSGEVPDEEIATRVYSGSYTKNGVQIYEAQATSVFDSPVSLTIQYRGFLQTDSREPFCLW